MVAWCVCVCDALPQALFFSEKNEVPVILMPCVCVMHCRKRLFFSKNDVPGILWDVLALLRSCYVPQALFFRQTVTHKWLWLYL
jgi:hypothetical protein